MANDHRSLQRLAHEFCDRRSLDELTACLEPDTETAITRMPGGPGNDAAARAARWAWLDRPEQQAVLDADLDPAASNIEYGLGAIQLPLGVAGPLRLRGLHAQGDYLLPLATHEAALVASLHRGAGLISRAGGCSAVLLAEGVTRSPGFAFANVRESGRFLLWALEQEETFRAIAATTTKHGRLEELRIIAEGNHVYLLCDFSTGDAAGQNMVTIATQAVVEWILANSPVAPAYHFVEANASGDKKASAQSFGSVRGKKVTAEVVIPARLLRAILHCSAERMVDYWRMSAMGGVLTGTIGVQGHYANPLAALFLATGQDVACVAEAAVGVTRFETQGDDLYAAVTLPNLIVGTVGGGTGLPHQRACLELMGLAGGGHARALAEVCAGCALAGELSIIGALAAGEFTAAHERLARTRQQTDG